MVFRKCIIKLKLARLHQYKFFSLIKIKRLASRSLRDTASIMLPSDFFLITSVFPSSYILHSILRYQSYIAYGADPLPIRSATCSIFFLISLTSSATCSTSRPSTGLSSSFCFSSAIRAL